MRVAVLTYDDISLFELGCAVELFALPRPEIPNWYRTDVVTFDNQPLKSSAGLSITAKIITSLIDYDMVVIPSWLTTDEHVPEKIVDELQQLSARGGTLISFCSGAFLLAKTGLLDGRNATTHWQYAERFKQQHQNIHYIENVLYLFDGALGCSAGSAAAIDLGIAVIKHHFGYKIANQVARRLVISAHRNGGQAQFVETPVIEQSSQFAPTLEWATTHLHQTIHIDHMAAKANMTRRTFDRKFKSSFNMTAKEWLTQQRIALAKELLETTQHSIDVIAGKAGFDNAVTLRHHFRKVLKLSPSQFRSQLLS